MFNLGISLIFTLQPQVALSCQQWWDVVQVVAESEWLNYTDKNKVLGNLFINVSPECLDMIDEGRTAD